MVGLGALEAAIGAAIRSLLEAGGGGAGGAGAEGVLITRERHRRHVKACVEHLDAFLSSRLPMDAAAEVRPHHSTSHHITSYHTHAHAHASRDHFITVDTLLRAPWYCLAQELRLAMLELGKVTGRVDVEELLDVIFRDFCIGK